MSETNLPLGWRCSCIGGCMLISEPSLSSRPMPNLTVKRPFLFSLPLAPDSIPTAFSGVDILHSCNCRVTFGYLKWILLS